VDKQSIAISLTLVAVFTASVFLLGTRYPTEEAPPMQTATITAAPTPTATTEPTYELAFSKLNIPAPRKPVYALTSTERDLVAAVCYFEANIDGIEGMQAVAEVILNRLLDGRFGLTVADVCTVTQFHGLRRLGAETVTEGAYEAVDSVFDVGQADTTNGGLFFCTEATDPDAIKGGLRETATILHHVFYTDLEAMG